MIPIAVCFALCCIVFVIGIVIGLVAADFDKGGVKPNPRMTHPGDKS